MAKSKSNRAALTATNIETPAGDESDAQARLPQSLGDQIICAKSIIQAVMAAHDSEALAGANYDPHWPLSAAVELLERAAEQAERTHAHG